MLNVISVAVDLPMNCQILTECLNNIPGLTEDCVVDIKLAVYNIIICAALLFLVLLFVLVSRLHMK